MKTPTVPTAEGTAPFFYALLAEQVREGMSTDDGQDVMEVSEAGDRTRESAPQPEG